MNLVLLTNIAKGLLVMQISEGYLDYIKFDHMGVIYLYVSIFYKAINY